MFLIDSSAWIEYFRPNGSSNVKQRVRGILQKDGAVTCGVVLVEVLRGARNERDYKAIHDALMSLPVMPADETVVERAAQWGYSLARKGKTPPTTDLMIAAAAHEKAVLLHVDQDFEVMGSLLGLAHERIAP